MLPLILALVCGAIAVATQYERQKGDKGDKGDKTLPKVRTYEDGLKDGAAGAENAERARRAEARRTEKIVRKNLAIEMAMRGRRFSSVDDEDDEPPAPAGTGAKA